MKLHRRGLFAASFLAAVLALGAIAPAAVEMSSGIRYLETTGTLADCSAKAKTALSAYLQTPVESTPGSGEWIATGPSGSTAGTAAATVRCFALSKGYVVTFTCVTQTPDNPYGAADLCIDVAHNFSGKPVTPLATPTPIPTGCTTASLVGTWTSDDKPGLSFTFDATGDLTDSDGVSGSWHLNGMSAAFAYYGIHTLQLSADGKHLRGDGYSLTRKC